MVSKTGSNQPPVYFDRHGYFFVRLPKDKLRQPWPGRIEAPTPHHARIGDDEYSGTVTCVLVTESPLYVGSGLLRENDATSGGVTRDVMRGPDGRPLIPGSSLKGTFRAIAEAASRSCVSMATEDDRRRPFRYSENQREFPGRHVRIPDAVSRAVSKSRSVRLELDPLIVDPLVPCQADDALCPCCGLFGLLGYRGRVSFSTAEPVGAGTTEVHQIPALFSPRAHRLAHKDYWASDAFEAVGGWVRLHHIVGRKFYPHLDCSPNGDFGRLNRQLAQQFDPSTWKFVEPIEAVPIGARFRFTLSVRNAKPWEIGLLLFALGQDVELGPDGQVPWMPKLGGGKAVGLGSVRIEVENLDLQPGGALYRAYRPGDEAKGRLNPVDAVRTFLQNEGVAHLAGVADLRRGLSTHLREQDIQVVNPERHGRW
jgi:CRISPR-associated protein Csm3